MRTTFDEQLKALHVDLIRMGGMCEEAISLAVKALLGEADLLAPKVFPLEVEIDSLEREVETRCMKLLLQQQPVAKDLRRISAALRMIADLERIGDQAADIAELAPYIAQKAVEGRMHLRDMARATVAMVTDSIDAYVRSDLDLAHQVIAGDDIVDSEFLQVKSELLGLIQSRAIDAEAALDLLMAAKYFERIGDHAVNVAEWVEYSVTGEHKSSEHHAGLC